MRKEEGGMRCRCNKSPGLQEKEKCFYILQLDAKVESKEEEEEEEEEEGRGVVTHMEQW